MMKWRAAASLDFGLHTSHAYNNMGPSQRVPCLDIPMLIELAPTVDLSVMSLSPASLVSYHVDFPRGIRYRSACINSNGVGVPASHVSTVLFVTHR